VVYADYSIDWHTIDGGGAMVSTGGDFELSGTVGQPDASTVILTGDTFELTGGFWPGAAGVSLPGDHDNDGDVDLDDFAALGLCLDASGPEGGLAAECVYFDFNGDGDVDLEDFAAFQTLFTGS
jgi:hypothetical protein